MNYYYDVAVNFQKTNCFYFDWLEKDDITNIKKIPIILIPREKFNAIYKNKIKINTELFNIIKNKTIFSNKSHGNCILFCDKSNSIVLKFNNNGVEQLRSSLTFLDDENVCNYIFTNKKENIKVELLESIPISYSGRKIEYIRSSIIRELDNLYKNNNIAKLKYCYFEIYNKNEESMELIINTLKDKVKNSNNISDFKTMMHSLNYNL